jgi:pantoate kinase
MLSEGVLSKVTATPAKRDSIRISVNGSVRYDAKTTRLALSLLIAHEPHTQSALLVEQRVDVPIGQGFGASAASALSAVLAAGSILAPGASKERIAYYAHAADILAGTGLGTVSVAYNSVGAGIIVRAGAPGIASFLNVSVPTGISVVTASLAPGSKRQILRRPRMRSKLNRLGRTAQRAALEGKSFDALMVAGEVFSRRLGLISDREARLLNEAYANGALFASQNMVGHAIHSIVPEKLESRVARALTMAEPTARIDVMKIGWRKAGTYSSGRLR